MQRRIVTFAMLALVLSGVVLSARSASAHLPSNHPFYLTWARTDEPVAYRMVDRTWMWGPEAFTSGMVEPYAESPDGMREVQYYDKSRMEINDWSADPTSPWYVTNGLLVVELITGRMQAGDDSFDEREPAYIPVAGDVTATSAPTYAALAPLMGQPAHPLGSVIATSVAHDGAVGKVPQMAEYGATAAYHVEATGHTVASPFWSFMNSTGLVSDGGMTFEGMLFRDPFYATGYPITEAYWTRTLVNGTEKDVLVQAFERRVLTYTPGNPEGWKVEAGNVGRHYHAWRYGSQPTDHEVLFSIPVGPAGLEYRFGSEPTPELVNYGPNAISVAPDGTFWIADAAFQRLVHYDAFGVKLNEIDLLEYGAASVFDVEASTGDVWVLFANLDAGLFRLGRFIPEGQLLRMYELHEDPLVRDYMGYTPGITITDGGAVVLVAGGEELVRIVDADGDQDNTDVTERVYDGHEYELRFDAMTRHVVAVDHTEVVIQGRDGDFAISTQLVDQVAGDSFVAYVVYVPDATDEEFLYTAQRFSLDGQLLGVAELPTNERFVHVQFDLVVGPDGQVYQLMTYPDRIDVLRLAFEPVSQ